MGQKTILIIDDDQTLVTPLKDGLESIGYRVAVAFDGLQGVLQAHQTHPDVIILDLNMPGGGGQNVYERLRKTPEMAATPIIFSTGISVEELKEKIALSPNTFFLRKPVGLNQFVSVLNSVLGAAAAPAEPSPFSAVPRPVVPVRVASPPAPKPAPKAGPKFHEFAVRVTYADTDKMGIIYYANYFRYFEQGRTELLRSLGVRYRDLEVQRKLFIPAVEAHCDYLAPSRYDDLLTVRTWISSLGKASVSFENEIYDSDLGGKKVAHGYSRHAVVNDLWRAARVPDDLRKLMEPYVGSFSA